MAMADLIRLKTVENQLQKLMANSDKDALAQSMRLLALYVAAYKEHYGELDESLIKPQFTQSALDEHTVQLFETGLHEAIAMLSMVRTARGTDHNCTNMDDRKPVIN
jgi:hypothetical protein